MRKLKLRTIDTPRLIIRRPCITDVHFMYYNWASDPEVTKYLTWSPHESMNVSELLIQTWINNENSLNWIIEAKKTKEAIGSISLFNTDYKNRSCEVGYCLSRYYWNQGLMTECIQYIVKYAFKKGMKTINALVREENIASIKVLEKNGFVEMGKQDKLVRYQKVRM
ncbi:MAG TPA: GNAT family N-acetyltransferase [Acholeplasmataceae bacterium]|nr:GNAT family N-acetyltransferase [Acholeplasmataceae bacterium]